MEDREKEYPYPTELLSRAEGMFLFEGLEYYQIAQKTGIPKQVLFRLASEENWEQRRAEFSSAEKTLLIRKMYIKANKALEDNISSAPQIIYALTNLEKFIANTDAEEAGYSYLRIPLCPHCICFIVNV